jgi:hypothetical protein
MLIDDVEPDPEFVQRVSIRVNASPHETMRALREVTLRDMPLASLSASSAIFRDASGVARRRTTPRDRSSNKYSTAGASSSPSARKSGRRKSSSAASASTIRSSSSSRCALPTSRTIARSTTRSTRSSLLGCGRSNGPLRIVALAARRTKARRRSCAQVDRPSHAGASELRVFDLREGPRGALTHHATSEAGSTRTGLIVAARNGVSVRQPATRSRGPPDARHVRGGSLSA